MSASRKFDLSSGSPDRPLYASGHRGSYGGASLDRSGSFRENMENPLLSSLPNMTRSSSSATQADVLNFFQCVRFDPKSMVVEHKLNRPGEFKRLVSSAVGIPTVDSLPASSKIKQQSSSSPEDLRRLKSGARESGTKARERVKILNDCLSVINKCFPSIPSKKRSRLDALSNDRSYSVLPIDRSAAGMGIGKMGSQNHGTTSGFELELQKCDERTKNAIRNKRPRTSMIDSKMDVRANTPPARPSGTMDKDRDVVRLSNGGVVQGEDRALSIVVDGWEKSKMKKKRTGIKQDIAASSMVTKPVDGYRESKQGMQPGFPTEPRPRLTVSHSFRSGIANGDASTGKTEATSQSSSGMRSSISRTDSENSSILHERRERPGGQEKERVNLKVSNKEDCLISGSNLNANVRAPRSGSFGGMSRLSPVVQRSTSSNDWEPSNCTSKLPGVLGANNRKRTSSARSSSPPVANWVQKPQKISRTARRTNLLPIVSGNDENPALETTSNVMVNERHLPAHSPHQVKIKSDHISPAVSESEESGVAEAKFRDKSKKYDEIDEKNGQNVQKMSNLLLPPRKNKAVSRDDHGDGVRRQGRTGRRFASSRPLLPLTVENLGNVGAAKQIRSSRLGLDKTESRAGRPPTRKLSDRKAYTRQKHIPTNMTADYRVGSDDGHEELLAAANAVTDTAQALSSPFWKEMETLFRFISDKDISYLEDQVNLGPAVDTPAPAPAPLDADSSTLKPNGCGLNEFGREGSDTELSPEHVTPGAKTPNGISLCQRLMASLIPEDGNLELFFTEKEDKYDVYGSRFEIETDVEADTFCSRMSQSSELSGYPSSNGYGVNTNGKLCYEMDHSMRDTNIVTTPDPGVILRHDHLQNSLLGDQVMPDTACSEYQYQNMSINERLLLEVKSIGIYPDLGPDLAQRQDEDINRNINILDEKYQEQVPRKKSLLGKLLGSVSEAKVLQEKNFEEHALDKLVVMAYEKYMSCWGPYAHGMKSASGKMAKQAALSFVKRALERYQEFEVTGKSCFEEPLYKDMFLSGVSRLIDGQPLNWNTDNESGKLLRSTSGCSVEVRTSAPVGTQQSPSNNQETYSSEALLSPNLCYAQNTSKQDSWSNKVKRRELLLDDVGGTINSSPGVPSGLGGSLSRSAKGKRSERDREGKGNSREVLSRSGTTKISRPASATVKGERKSKAKPKQKNAHLSASVNGPLGNMPEQPKLMLSPTLRSSDISRSDIDKDKNDYSDDMLEEPIDLSGLQLPEMDDLGVPDDLGGQGEDIGSWLNIEDEVLQDHDYIGGLEIPMDDLSDLNMMV